MSFKHNIYRQYSLLKQGLEDKITVVKVDSSVVGKTNGTQSTQEEQRQKRVIKWGAKSY